MAFNVNGINKRQRQGSKYSMKGGFAVPVATKLIISFLFIIVAGNVIFTVVGIRLINNRIVTEAQERVFFELIDRLRAEAKEEAKGKKKEQIEPSQWLMGVSSLTEGVYTVGKAIQKIFSMMEDQK